MYYMSTYAKVRRLFHRDHLSISEIQRRTSLSRNTIKAWLKETSPDGYKYPNDHEDAFITPENERYCAGGSGTRSIKFLEI